MTTAASLPADEYLTTDEVGTLHDVLVAKLEALLAEHREQVRVATEERTVETDEIDFAVSETNRAWETRMADRELALLGKVRRGMNAMADGIYGTCEQCGDAIGYQRLLARPVARMCIDCKTENEQIKRSNRAF